MQFLKLKHSTSSKEPGVFLVQGTLECKHINVSWKSKGSKYIISYRRIVYDIIESRIPIFALPLAHCRFLNHLDSLISSLVKNLPAKAGDARDVDLIPGSIGSPGVGNENALQYFLPGKFHGQRILASYSPWGLKELDMTKQAHTHTYKENKYCHGIIGLFSRINENTIQTQPLTLLFTYS